MSKQYGLGFHRGKAAAVTALLGTCTGLTQLAAAFFAVEVALSVLDEKVFKK